MAYTQLIWFTYSEYFGKTVVKSPGTTIYSWGQLIGKYKSAGSVSGRYGIKVYSKEFGKGADWHVIDCVQGAYGLEWEIKFWDADLIMPDNQLQIIVQGTSGSSSCSHVDWEKVITFIPRSGWQPEWSLPTISLSSLPSLSLQLESKLRILPTVSLQSLPSLSLSELKNIFFTLFRTLPPLPSLSVSLELISRFPPKFTLEDLPALFTSLELLPFPHDVLTDTIVAENARAVAEAAFEHARRFNITGYTQPPFFCFICGETFNNHDDFITHLISHVQAYEENNYE